MSVLKLSYQVQYIQKEKNNETRDVQCIPAAAV